MKRTTAAVGMFLCAVFVLPAIASESFALNIPLRGNPQQETGEVRITLTLNASPAGSQLVVNGNATLNLGDPRAPLRVARPCESQWGRTPRRSGRQGSDRNLRLHRRRTSGEQNARRGDHRRRRCDRSAQTVITFSDTQL